MRTTLNQLYEAMTFLYGGCVIGIVSELMSFFRRRLHRRASLAAMDLLLAAAIVGVSAAAFLIATRGVLRLFGFILLLAGYLLTHWTFHPRLHVV